MSYTVLARKYRSVAFGEVVGQESIAKTLTNAIATGRVAHAYLFTGTRGVGKTSMARIFARALNAPDTIDDCPRLPGQDYPDADVQARMAEAVMRGDDLNVIEIDGASNNSVDQARQLIANAGLAPTGNASFKVYIIDEVHMLSTAAFNALLKTMEEPPPHVKFILCTTEPHKVPVTIQSRCQRFDFRNIATAGIADHLRDVLKREKVKANDDVIWQVARLGNGSMRDALTLLDRLIATAAEGEKLTTDMLELMLGLPAQDLITGLVDALADGDTAAALKATAGLLDRGVSQEQLIDSLIEWLRQLMLVAACGADSELIELSDDARAKATQQAGRFDGPALVHMIALCENLQRSGKVSSNRRALLDAVVVRLSLAEKMADVTALLAGRATTPSSKPAAAKSGGSSKPAPAAPQKKKPPANVNADPPPAPARAAAPAVQPEPRAEPASPRQPAPVPPIAPATETNPDGAWQELLGRIADKPSMGWVNSFTLRRLDTRAAYLDTLPGRRDMRKFLSDHTRGQLASLLGDVLGRPVRIELDAGASDKAPPADVPQDGPAGRVDPDERRHALGLPLVKQVLENFDATLLEVRSASQGEDKEGSA